jgi:hypothetical protein
MASCSSFSSINRSGSSMSLFDADSGSLGSQRELSPGWFTDSPQSGRCRGGSGRPSCDEAAGLAVLLGMGSSSYY